MKLVLEVNSISIPAAAKTKTSSFEKVNGKLGWPVAWANKLPSFSKTVIFKGISFEAKVPEYFWINSASNFLKFGNG